MSSMQSVIFVFARVDLIEISSDTNHIIYGLLLFGVFRPRPEKSSNVNRLIQNRFYSALRAYRLFWQLVEALFK